MPEPLEVARELNEHWASVPFETLREALTESGDFEDSMRRFEEAGHPFPVELISPEIEVDMSAFPGGATLPSGRGRDVFTAFFREWVEPWAGLTTEALDYEQLGERVLVEMRVRARGGVSGVATELGLTQLWTIRDGMVVRYEVFPDREQARAAIPSAEGAG